MTMIAPNPQPDRGRAPGSGPGQVPGHIPGANDLIEAMTGRRYLSWSQLNAYRGCPRRWFYSHVEGLEPEFVNAALLLGSAFHAAVQHHYEQQFIGQPVTHDQLCEVFRRNQVRSATPR